MPTIFSIKGWRIFFFANEGNEPIHIHGEKGSANCKFWILIDEYDIKPAYTRRMTPSEIREVRKIIFDHFDMIIEAWNEFEKRKEDK